MQTELENVRARMKDLIIGTCNTIGCEKCPNKWDKAKRAVFIQQ